MDFRSLLGCRYWKTYEPDPYVENIPHQRRDKAASVDADAGDTGLGCVLRHSALYVTLKYRGRKACCYSYLYTKCGDINAVLRHLAVRQAPFDVGVVEVDEAVVRPPLANRQHECSQGIHMNSDKHCGRKSLLQRFSFQ